MKVFSDDINKITIDLHFHNNLAKYYKPIFQYYN